MLHYLKSPTGHAHLVDELHETEGDERKTLCGRTVMGGSVYESDSPAGCGSCVRALKRLQRQLDATVAQPPSWSAPRPQAAPDDLLCPVCGQPMGLAVKRYSFPRHRVNAVRVTMMLICDNEDGHQEKP